MRSSSLGFRLLGLTILAGVAGVAARHPLASETFTAFVPKPLPQRAPADFDGDGRPDLAVIQDEAHGRRILINLSGSWAAISLEETVVSLIAADIDHDGDVDILATAPSGALVAWVNDGQGRFTPWKPVPLGGLSDTTPTVQSRQMRLLAVGAQLPSGESLTRDISTEDVRRARPPTDLLALNLSLLCSPSFRAPPLLVNAL